MPNRWDNRKRECKVIIETPKGSRNKFDYDPEFGLFTLAALLSARSPPLPFDFGFIPSTLGEDGDPLDVLVLMDEPAHVGCLVDVRIIGVIEAQQTEKGRRFTNNRLMGVALHSFAHQQVNTIDDVERWIVTQVQEFFITYNKSRGKEFKPKGIRGPGRTSDAHQ